VSGNDTKERILAAAERLIADRGFAATSLRTVTAAAGVNLAAVHYHFGTKEALLQEVFSRRIGPVNQQRCERLAALEVASGGRPLAVEAVLEAFLAPLIGLKHDLEGEGMVWSRFIGRVYAESPEVVEKLVRNQFADIGRRIVAALGRALPHLTPQEIFERLQFAIGMMTHTLTDLHRISIPEEFRGEPHDAAETLRHMVIFLAAAFRAPASRNATRLAPLPESKAS
jgi:AcrR family transcriptional regulator